MASLNDRMFNLGLLLGQGIGGRQNEGKATKALKALLGDTPTYQTTALSGESVEMPVGAMSLADNNNDGVTLSQLAKNASANNSYDLARDIQAANSQSNSPLLRAMANSQDGNGATATNDNANAALVNGYNANADYGVDMNNPYSMAIMNAKNDYYRAQKLGNEAGMQQAEATAEQARAQAQAAGVPIQSFLANNGVDYAQALALNDQLRNAQVNGNQNFSYTDLANGNVPTAQTMNPTQGVVEQNPVNAGMAIATASKGVTTPTIGNQQTAQTPTAPSTYDVQAGWNKYINSQTGGSANPFPMGVNRY